MALAPDRLDRLLRALCVPGMHTHAVIDGAACPNLLDQIDREQPDHVCLYRGELEAPVAHVAPWLVRLEPESEFSRWLLGEGWGRGWFSLTMGIQPLHALRSQFRRLLLVKLPDGRIVYFRFYDPRVLRLYLRECGGEEATAILGMQAAFVTEAADAGQLHLFRAAATGIGSEVRRLDDLGTGPLLPPPED
ncbi:DUF4123 domain-containing protein [Niveispirillum sp. KHB5.9]|uniref:DUF4123 domain-containing protein n=1 Tax=Niveispirillum sp. KHB5.9 TaxID=3400269 RepID=UPI003A867B4B